MDNNTTTQNIQDTHTEVLLTAQQIEWLVNNGPYPFVCNIGKISFPYKSDADVLTYLSTFRQPGSAAVAADIANRLARQNERNFMEAFDREFPGSVDVSVPPTIPDEFAPAEGLAPTTGYDWLLHYLFTTALEGGIGYWSQASSYRHEGRTRTFYSDIEIEDEIEERDVHDAPEGTAIPVGKNFHINRLIMDRGYRLALSMGERIGWSSGEMPPTVFALDIPMTEDQFLDAVDWDYDADDADIIVQLGLFGAIVFG